jgi:hypothetical protein
MTTDPEDAHSNPVLLPAISPASEPFWAAAMRGVLMVQRCVDTGRLIFPPRPRSPYGERRPPEWTMVSGLASVWSFVVPHPPLTPQFAVLAPYNVIVVALDEDPTVRMVGNLIADVDAEINSVDPSTIRIGEKIHAVFPPALTAEIRLPRWVRRE